MLSDEHFNLILAYYAGTGLVTMLLAFIGGKASLGMRLGMGVLGLGLAGYAGYVYFGAVQTIYVPGRLAVLPIVLVIVMAIAMVKGPKKTADVPPATGPAGPSGFPTAGAPPAQQQGFPVAGQAPQYGQPQQQAPQYGQPYGQNPPQYPQPPYSGR